MELLDSRAVSVGLASYVRDRLAESDFFSELSVGEVPPEQVRDVFGQYYVWRGRLHRWLGVCVAKIAPADDGLNVPRVLGELIEFLAQEIEGDKRETACSFLSALGVDDAARITALPVTDAYAESFPRCYLPADRAGDEALAALAGRQLVVPSRNRIIMNALPWHYGVSSGLELFRLHPDLEVERFQVLWEEFARESKVDPGKLIEAAQLEIWEHITFWDDVYSTVRVVARPPVANRVMAPNN